MITLEIPEHHFPGELLNLNALRGHTAHLGRLARPWRQLAAIEARAAKLGTVNRPVTIWVLLRFPTNHRRDSANYAPTAKALVDGLVDARVLPDDCDGIVYGPHVEREYPNGPRRITIRIEPRSMA